MGNTDDKHASEAVLERLREAVALAKTLSFNAAAALLHISQPTLTRHIASLEKDLGFQLFHRFPMGLTPEGQYFVTATEKLLADYDAVIKRCREMAKRSREAVVVNVVTASKTLWGNIVYEAIAIMQERYPDVPAPRFCQNKTVPIEASVYSGEADVGLIFREPSPMPEGFACRLLTEFSLAAYFPHTNPLAGRDYVTLDDLSEQYLVCPTNPQLRTTFDGAVDTFRRNGREPRYRIRELDEFDSLAFLLGPDEFVFGNAVHGEAIPAEAPLSGSPLVAEHMRYPVYLLYRENPSKPLVRAFIDTCQEIADR